VPKIVILATAVGFTVVQLDVSIVNVALATIARDLHSAIAGLQWIVDVYTIAFAALLLIAGPRADRFGARRMLVGGFLVFGCASLCCALTPNITV
jgi:DHA2 family methylenomycin A resistance protein-like MFS transporter